VRQNLKQEKLLTELVEVAERLFTEVRHEQGRFLTGSCHFLGKNILLVNKRQTVDERIVLLASEIARAGTEKLYLKPAIRAEIDRYASTEE